jgi:hypothetical protein
MKIPWIWLVLHVAILIFAVIIWSNVNKIKSVLKIP